MPYAELPGVHLWYTDSGGAGRPVVFMHAASGTTESWVAQLAAFEAAGYRCITFDRRNWGRTHDGSIEEQPRTNSEDLQGLLDLLGVGQVHLIGTAAGGVGALDFAVTHPERLKSLVVADCIGGVQDPAYLAVQQRLRPPEIQALPVELRELSAGYRGMDPEGTQAWIEIDRAGHHEGGRAAQRPPQPLTLSLLETLTMPVLVLAGEADLVTPPALTRLLAAPIPNARFATVPEAGHAAFWEQPEVWNRLVLDFLRQSEPARGSAGSRLPAGGYADLPGVRLWYSDSGGDGVPVVLLHANTGNSDSWQYNMPALVAAGYRVIAFDRRGWGRSAARPESGPEPGSIAEDLEALAGYLLLEPFHLVGVAGGGFAAFDYALWHPERLRSLVVAASTGMVQDSALAEMTSRIRGPEFAALPPQFKEVSFSYMATNPEGLARWLEIEGRSQQPGAPAQPLHAEVTFAELEALRLPVMLLAASNDLLAAPYIMRMQAEHIPQAEFILVPEAGHAINWEQPDVFNQHLLAFLARH